MRYKIPEGQYSQIVKETNDAIARGYDHARAEWKLAALQLVYDMAAGTEKFSVNDFRRKLLELPMQTHDLRAIGGLMTTAKRYGWIERSGETSGSLVAHLVPVQVWKSLIYGRALPQPEQGTLL